MRIGEGIIEEIQRDGFARVRVNKDHLYVACSECFGADRVFVTAYNPISAQEGQAVRYEVEDGHLIASSFMCFIVPLLGIAIAAVLGYLAMATASAAIIGVVVGALISGAIIKQYGTYLGNQIDTQARITEIIDTEQEEEA